MDTLSTPLLSLKNIRKTFSQNNNSFDVLKNINFDLFAEEMVALTGASGTGKTTLLQIMGLLDLPTEGTVTVGNVGFPSTSKSRAYTHLKQRDSIRQKFIGFVYQYHHLLPELTALENIVLPQLIAGISKDLAENHAKNLLCELNLEKRLHHFPTQLSGGEQQRVAIARALANTPQIILADEPTGNLDDKTAYHVFNLLLDLTQQKKIAIVIATHNIELAKKMTRNIQIHLGEITEFY